MKLAQQDLYSDKAGFYLRAVAYLNGEIVRYCIEADEEEGYVIRHALDESGRVQTEGGEVVMERVGGVVEIIDPLGLSAPMRSGEKR